MGISFHQIICGQNNPRDPRAILFLHACCSKSMLPENYPHPGVYRILKIGGQAKTWGAACTPSEVICGRTPKAENTLHKSQSQKSGTKSDGANMQKDKESAISAANIVPHKPLTVPQRFPSPFLSVTSISNYAIIPWRYDVTHQ